MLIHKCTIKKISGYEDEPPSKIKKEKAKAQKEFTVTRAELYRSAIEALKCPTQATPTQTEEEAFGSMVAKTLMRMSERQKIFAKKRISDVLFNIEMGMDTASVPPPPTGFNNQNFSSYGFRPNSFEVDQQPPYNLF